MSNRYNNIKVIKSNQGKRYYKNNIYPEIPLREDDIYVITSVTDRLDVLANDFYGDSTLYWIIASANNLPGDSLIPTPGMQLRIPTNFQSVINDYIALNNSQ